MRRVTTGHRVGAALAVAILALTALAVAEEAETPAGATAAEAIESDGDMPVSVGGMTVFIDRKTGRLRQPTAREAAALAREMKRMFGTRPQAAAPIKEISLKGGGVAVELGLEHLDYSVATVDADGQVGFKCLDSAHDAKSHVHNQVSAPEEK